MADDSHLTKANVLTTEGIELRSISNKRRIMEYNNAAMSPAFKRYFKIMSSVTRLSFHQFRTFVKDCVTLMIPRP